MKNRLGKKNIFNPIVQDLEKHSSTAQQLASRDWHRVNNREELQPGGGRRKALVGTQANNIQTDTGWNSGPETLGEKPGATLDPP